MYCKSIIECYYSINPRLYIFKKPSINKKRNEVSYRQTLVLEIMENSMKEEGEVLRDFSYYFFEKGGGLVGGNVVLQLLNYCIKE